MLCCVIYLFEFLLNLNYSNLNSIEMCLFPYFKKYFLFFSLPFPLLSAQPRNWPSLFSFSLSLSLFFSQIPPPDHFFLFPGPPSFRPNPAPLFPLSLQRGPRLSCLSPSSCRTRTQTESCRGTPPRAVLGPHAKARSRLI